MDIIYKFTSNATGRFYIGSKTECEIVDGKIFSREGITYYGSCKTEEYWEDLKANGMTLECLEKVKDKSKILERETYYQKKYNAIDSPLGYNKIYANMVNSALSKDTMGEVVNSFGESRIERMRNNSATSKKDSKAKSLGFKNFGEMYLVALSEKARGVSYNQQDIRYNQKGFFKRVCKGISLEEYQEVDLIKVKSLLFEGASFLKACQILGYPEWVVREQFKDESIYSFTKKDRVAFENNFRTTKDLTNYIMREFLSGKSRQEISKNLKGTSHSSIGRYIDEEVKLVLDISDFK